DTIHGFDIRHFHVDELYAVVCMEFHQVFAVGHIRGGFVVNADDLGILFEEVETDIGIFLEKPQFAHLFHGNAAGSEVGDGSVFEFNSGIADVGGIAHHRNAAGADEFHFRVYQTQRQIEVVDHQIENDRNVRSS